MNKTTAIHHSADYDGLFCREIARKFLPDAELIGWDFGNAVIPVPDGQIYVLDLPVDKPFGLLPWADATPNFLDRLVWIDHHKSAIESHPKDIPGYRIDGVAACRLAWQWFRHLVPESGMANPFWERPTKEMFIERRLEEPLAVRLAGEYDIWDRRDPDAELFQHGLRSRDLTEDTWKRLLDSDDNSLEVPSLLLVGKAVQYAKGKENESIIKELGFTFQWEGLTFLACNAARYNSHLFTAGLTPEHDACFGFKWTGKDWSVSLYHAPGKEHHDLSLIAVKHGGGGHRGACGFRTPKLPFIP